jgi:hypothetical protein
VLPNGGFPAWLLYSKSRVSLVREPGALRNLTNAQLGALVRYAYNGRRGKPAASIAKLLREYAAE